MLYLLSIALIASSAWGCPMKEALFPCTCERPDDSAYVTCAGLLNEQDLVSAAGSLVGKRYVYSLVIEGSVLSYIPSDAFKGTRFVELEIVDSSLMSLTDTDLAFEGLEEHLEVLIIRDCTLMGDWDWAVFRDLRRLTRLDVVRANLRSVDQDMDQVNATGVRDVSFAGNQISFLHDFAFAKFNELMFLSLSDNLIVDVKRSMLPQPASSLVMLDLSNNLIEELPSNMFTSMPVLETLSIGNNKILVLKEETFRPVWSQLQGFAAMGNELRCDCRLAWILETGSPADVRAICAKPQEVKGKNLKDLSSKDLWCYLF